MDKLTFQYDKSLGIPKYQQLADALMHYIRHYRIAPGASMPSDKKLSRQFKVSTATVNKGYNELVRCGLLERVVGAGTFVAGAPAAIRKNAVTIGIFSHETIRLDQCYVSEILTALEQYAQAANWNLKIIVRSPEYFGDIYNKEAMQGMILFTPLQTIAPIVTKLRALSIPVACVGTRVDGHEDISFDTDNHRVVAAAVNFLHQKGHRKIGVVIPLSQDEESGSSLEREGGFMRGMYQCLLPLNPDWIMKVDTNMPGDLQHKLENLRRQGALPTALLIAQHRILLSVYKALRELQLAVPGDISLMGFDDPEYAVCLSPPLTVFKQDIDLISRSVMEHLARKLRGEEEASGGLLAMSILTERDSCKNIDDRE